MTESHATTKELVYTRVFAAPRELVYRCMTEPPHLARFWGPKGTTTPVDGITIDLRPGGVFETVMVNDADGSRYTMTARYLTVDPPELLVWVDSNSGVTTSTTFIALDDTRTEVEIRQSNVPEAFELPENRTGFATSLDRSYDTLADLLDRRSAADWDTPSLCEGWRVREVVAHVTMPARYDEAAFMAELHEDDFDFERLSPRIAARDADLPIAELVANLRSETLHRWSPPGGDDHAALNHAVIHSLDITVPLGEPRCATDDAIRTVLDDLTGGGVHAHFGTEIEGRHFIATDIDWSYGTGAPVSDTATALALGLCGRTVANTFHRS
jgi:uncharacterized protein (TIGR03083 family)